MRMFMCQLGTAVVEAKCRAAGRDTKWRETEINSVVLGCDDDETVQPKIWTHVIVTRCEACR